MRGITHTASILWCMSRAWLNHMPPTHSACRHPLKPPCSKAGTAHGGFELCLFVQLDQISHQMQRAREQDAGAVAAATECLRATSGALMFS